jgi:hypothetical protein
VPDVDTALIAGGFALLGGFLGQYVYAGRLAKHAHRDAQLEQLRQDRIQAYSDFAGALIEYRRTQLARWFAEHADPREQEDVRHAAHESRVQRAAAHDRYFRVRLLADSADIKAAAKQALDCTNRIHDATTHEEANTTADHVRDDLLRAFIEVSEDQVLVRRDTGR